MIDEINQSDWTYYFEGNTFRKRYDYKDFIELLKRSGEMKLEERKEQENLFKSNLNQISRGRFKSKEQKSPSENIELF